MIKRRTELLEQFTEPSEGRIIHQELVTYMELPDGSFIRELTVRSFTGLGFRDHNETLVIGASEFDA